MGDNGKSVIINAVDRSLDILEYLYEQDGDVPITQISRDLGIYKSTVYRTLVTLENRGFVRQNPDTGRHSLGFKIYLLGSRMKSESAFDQLVRPYAEKLSRQFREAVNVSVLSLGQEGEYLSLLISKVNGGQTLTSVTQVGSMTECYCSAVGKCLLAFTSSVDLSVYEHHAMTKYTENTITNVADLQAELQRVRKNRYAVDNEEREFGLYCIGMPILRHGEAVAAISLSGPTQRMKHQKKDEMLKALREVSEEISMQMET